MPLVVVLDASVLYPIALTDFFLTLAGNGHYQPHWSTEILREVERNLLVDHPGLTAETLAYRFREMNHTYPDALIDPPANLIDEMTNDPRDRHVLATAVIATFNTRRFPPDACEAHGIEAQHPASSAGVVPVELLLVLLGRVATLQLLEGLGPAGDVLRETGGRRQRRRVWPRLRPPQRGAHRSLGAVEVDLFD